MKTITLPAEVVAEIANYLSGCRYREVAHLIAPLVQAVRATEAPPAPESSEAK